MTAAKSSAKAARAFTWMLDASVTWKEIVWLKSLTQLPVILKGAGHNPVGVADVRFDFPRQLVPPNLALSRNAFGVRPRGSTEDSQERCNFPLVKHPVVCLC